MIMVVTQTAPRHPELKSVTKDGDTNCNQTSRVEAVTKGHDTNCTQISSIEVSDQESQHKLQQDT